MKRSKKSRENAKQEKELWDLVRAHVFERDGGKCVFCGSTKMLGTMHLLPKGAYRKIRFEPINLRIGCYACHLGNRGWHKDSAPYWAMLEPGLRDRLLVADRCAPKVDVKLLLSIWKVKAVNHG